MSYIPTIEEIYSNIVNDLRNKLDLSDNDFKTVIDALALSLAGQFKLTYLTLSDIQQNVFPDTADSQKNGGTLERHGLIHLNRLQRPASGSVINIEVIADVGSVLRSGLTFKSNDGSKNAGKLFILDVEKITTSNPELVEVRSIEGGVDYNLNDGDELTITEPVIGVESLVSVESTTSQALSAETDSDYRNSIIEAIQLEPQGGAKTDYRLWAKDAQSVSEVYPYVKDGEAGTVQVYVEAVDVDSVDQNGTPSQSILDNVEEVINFDPDMTRPIFERGRRPIQANLEVLPIQTIPVDIEIVGLNVNTQAIQSNIRENLVAFLKTIRPFIDGADLLRNKNDVLYSARAQSVITDLIGFDNFFTDFIMLVDGVNQNSFIFSREKIPYLRNLNFN